MSPTTLLHALEFPDREICDADELYVRIVGEGSAGPGTVRLGPHSRADFDTYFNCFTVSAWNRSARLADVVMSIDVDASCTVEIWNTHAGGSSSLACVTTSGGPTVVAVPDHQRLSGICWLRIETGADPVTVRRGSWRTSTTPLRPVRLAVVMTTFQREAYVQRNLRLLDRYAAENAERLNAVRLSVVDNGRRLRLEPAEHPFGLEVIPNRNLGGAGGFARGLIAHRDEGWATHVAFADDDIVLPPALLDRTVGFLAYLTDPRRCLASSMLDEEVPVMQYECGATFSNRARHPTTILRTALDLTRRDSLILNSEAMQIDYGGWWFFAFPIELTADNPLPVFVRGDDVEFGLSHCRGNIEVMNGIGVWHQSFDYKNTPATFHLEARNHPLVGVLTDPSYGRRHMVGRFGSAALRFLLALKYSSGEHVLAGMREFVAGPERWLPLDDEAEFSRISRAGEERPAPLDPEVLGVPVVDNPSRLDPWTILTLGGHLVPSRWSRRPPIAAPIQTRQLAATIGRESVVYVDRPSGEGFIAVRDRRRFFAALGSLVTTVLLVWRRFPGAARDFRARRQELVGTASWERRIGRPDGSAR